MSSQTKTLPFEEVKKRVEFVLKGRVPDSVINELLDVLKDKEVTETQLEKILEEIIKRYRKTQVDPGEAVGTVGAQSIGEPSTQMILRTFHYAGIREFSMALGLPRLIEIVDARKKPSVPMMTIYLEGEYAKDPQKALEVARKIQQTTIENIARSVEVDYFASAIIIELDPELLKERNLSVDDVLEKLKSAVGKKGRVEKVGDYTISVTFEEVSMIKLRRLRDKILQVRISGIRNIRKAIVDYDSGAQEYVIRTEGTNLAAVLSEVEHVDKRRTISNDLHEVADVLGIEAARNLIVKEIKAVLDQQGLEVDPRHMMLVADMMTMTGRVRQIGRHGVAGEKESVLARAAFEVTVAHLFEAAFKGEYDSLRGPAESVIVGKPMSIGTGIVDVMLKFVERKKSGK